MGASNHTDKERQKEDFYATDPIASKLLMEMEQFEDTIIDNSYGKGHLMLPFIEKSYNVIGYDIENRIEDILPINLTFHHKDFLTETEKLKGDVVFNPPFKYAVQFIEHSLNLVEEGRKVCAFLKVQFLEGKQRKELFAKHPPKRIWVSSSRILCAKNADFEGMKAGGGSAVAYAWFVWEKGYKGNTVVKWFN